MIDKFPPSPRRASYQLSTSAIMWNARTPLAPWQSKRRRRKSKTTRRRAPRAITKPNDAKNAG